jgi:DHA2 family multidrug resistance protein
MAALQSLTDRYTTAFSGDTALGQAAAYRQLWNLVYREALTQTFADAFLLISVALFAMAALAPLMRSITPPKVPSADAH